MDERVFGRLRLTRRLYADSDGETRWRVSLMYESGWLPTQYARSMRWDLPGKMSSNQVDKVIALNCASFAGDLADVAKALDTAHGEEVTP